MHKKAQMSGVGMLVPLGITLVIIAIVLSLGQQILGDFRQTNNQSTVASNLYCQANDSYGGCTYAYNSTLGGQQGIDKIATKQTLIATVIVVGVLISIVVGSFAFAKRN